MPRNEEDWISLASRGRKAKLSSLKNVNNMTEPEDLSRLESEKLKRVFALFKSGKPVEMSIVVKRPDGGYDLLSGNTRQTVLRAAGVDPMVWVINEEFLGKKGGVRYYQMGGSIKNTALYNKDKSGKPTRDPGVAGLSSKTTKDTSEPLEKERDKKKRWYSIKESFESACMSGGCHYFAVALQRVFPDYSLGMLVDDTVEEYYDDDDGEPLPTIVHIFAHKGNRIIDAKGIRTIEDIKNDFFDTMEPRIDWQVSEDEIRSYSGEYKPLEGLDEDEITFAMSYIEKNKRKYKINPLKEAAMQVNDFDQATNLWFYECIGGGEMPEKLLDVLEKYAVPVHKKLSKCRWPTDCGEASDIWDKVFKKNGLKSEQVLGYYNKDHEPGMSQPGSTDHVWLEVEGCVFDPTAGQFGTNIQLENYWFDDENRAYKK